MSQRGFAIFFLTIYTLVLFQPLVPLIDYSLNKEYIAKNLCENRKKPGSRCNGKCYLAKELKKANQNQPSGSSAKNSSEEVLAHLNNTFDTGLRIVQNTNSFIKHADPYRPLAYEDGIEHPPCA